MPSPPAQPPASDPRDEDALKKPRGANQPTASQFQQLSTEDDIGLAAEFWLFLKEEKRWWLTPIILACLAITGLAWFTSTGAYPFIYSIF